MLFLLSKVTAHGLVLFIFSTLYDTVYLLAPTLNNSKVEEVKAMDLS